MTCSMTNACHGPAGVERTNVSEFSSMRYLINAMRPVVPSTCLPSSGSSAMDRSSSTDAMASCSNRQAHMKASLTAARLSGSVIERRAKGIEIAERRKELERARKEALTPKQLQQAPGA